MKLIAVALGGALGAALRYLISLIPVKGSFPVLTLLTNIAGALLIGFVVGLAGQQKNMSDNMVLFLKTGLCGGFTTFSTFSLEALTLFENKLYLSGSLYAVLSVVFCILGVMCGRKLAAACLS